MDGAALPGSTGGVWVQATFAKLLKDCYQCCSGLRTFYEG